MVWKCPYLSYGDGKNNNLITDDVTDQKIIIMLVTSLSSLGQDETGSDFLNFKRNLGCPTISISNESFPQFVSTSAAKI